MTQASKIIDITRSYVPINPNSFPETMHGTGAEDTPEQRFPVLAYKGYNFLPTSYGYKSFFGANARLNFDSLLPNKVDKAFMFQTLTYKNVLIALCNTGVWWKDSTVVGAWTQGVVLADPGDTVAAEWSVVYIQDKIYLYRAGAANFWLLATDGSTNGFSFTALTPSFITLTAQLGMSNFGGRIVFWDANNAIARSSPTDVTDFTPSVLTGADVTSYSSIHGRITTIRAHGKHAIAYSTKSIVFLEVQPSDTFIVKASPILPNAGVAYSRQVTESFPDTVHFVYTNVGIYKIESAQPESILTQLYDYFKEYTITPIYLKMLEGRYLCFETTDSNTVLGDVEFSTETVPGSTVIFPSISNDINTIPVGTTFCDVSSLYDKGYFAGSGSGDVPPDMKPGTFMSPVYTCYISNHGIKDPDALTFTTNPCGFTGPNGTVYPTSPSDSGNQLSKWTTNSTNKIPSFGPSAYVDGNWSMERFIALQTALWKMEQKVAQQVIDKILTRAFSETKITQNTNACVISNPAWSYCALGDYPNQFTDPQFGYNGCSFWLTRYCIGADRLRTATQTTVACSDDANVIGVSYYKIQHFGADYDGNHYATIADCVASLTATFGPGSWGWIQPANGTPLNPTNGSIAILGLGNLEPTGAYTVNAYWAPTAPYTLVRTTTGGIFPTFPVMSQYLGTGFFKKTEVGQAHNEIETTLSGVVGIESAYCERTHWKYTKNDGTTGYTASSACIDTSDKTPGSTATTRVVPQGAGQEPPITSDGNICGTPLTPSLDFPDVVWPSTNPLDYPGVTFLLQQGSLAPKYPTFAGAFVYDLQLKKWGKLKLDYKQLLDYSPLNTTTGPVVNIAAFGIISAVLLADGYFYQFDDSPSDSRITYGKIGYYRAGITDLEEIRFDFKSLSTGQLNVNISIDGASVSTDAISSTAFTSTRTITVYPSYNGKWFSAELEGKWDICYMEVKGLSKGRR
jgi:hypothetical protein